MEMSTVLIEGCKLNYIFVAASCDIWGTSNGVKLLELKYVTLLFGYTVKFICKYVGSFLSVKYSGVSLYFGYVKVIVAESETGQLNWK